MKQPSSFVLRSLGAAIVASAALAALACNKTEAGEEPKATATHEAPAGKVEGRLIEVVAEDSGYNPKEIPAKAGETLTLRFVRKTKSECLAEVAFPSLDVKKPLPMGTPVDIVVKAEKAGTIPFQCGMAMVFGKVVVSG